MALIRRRASAPQREPRSGDFEVADADPWQSLADDAPLPAAGDVIVSLARFGTERDALLGRARFGVRVPNDTPRDALADVAEHAALIVLDFPTQRDGRAYSLAQWLRSSLAFTGEIRATGKVVRDQLAYLARVGFDTFDLSRGSAQDALRSFDDLGVHYQAAVDQKLPLWKRVPRQA